MADTLVMLTLTATAVAALRKLGVIQGKTRRCRRTACKSAFIPIDNRQVFCRPSCAKADRQAKWRKAHKQRSKDAAFNERYRPLNFEADATIDKLPISTYLKNLCAKALLVTVADIRSKSDSDLLKVKDLGRKSLLELRRL